MSAETCTELERKKVIAMLTAGGNKDLIKLVSARIYTTTKDTDTWLYSDLEGLLCFVMDYDAKSRYFIMFDPDSYEVLYEMELYKNFNKYYHNVTEDVQCFEICNGFIGFKFFDNNEAKMFSLVVNRFDDNFVNILFESQTNKMKPSKKKINKKFLEYCNILKEKFATKNIYDDNYIEDGLEICKSRYFELLNNITFDREKKEFKIGNIPKEFKRLFKDIGIKKSDFKNKELALNIFKHLVETMDNIDNVKREKTVIRRTRVNNDFKFNKNSNTSNIKSNLGVIGEENESKGM